MDAVEQINDLQQCGVYENMLYGNKHISELSHLRNVMGNNGTRRRVSEIHSP